MGQGVGLATEDAGEVFLCVSPLGSRPLHSQASPKTHKKTAARATTQPLISERVPARSGLANPAGDGLPCVEPDGSSGEASSIQTPRAVPWWERPGGSRLGKRDRVSSFQLRRPAVEPVVNIHEKGRAC